MTVDLRRLQVQAVRRRRRHRGPVRQVHQRQAAPAPGRAPRSTASPTSPPTFGAKGLAYIAFREDGSMHEPHRQVLLRRGDGGAARRDATCEPGDLVMFAAERAPGSPTRSWAGCASTWPTPWASSARATTSCGSSTSPCSTGTRTASAYACRAPALHPALRGPDRPAARPILCPLCSLHLRLRDGRLRGRWRRHAHPRRRAADAHPQAARLHRGARGGAVRLPDGGAALRRAADGRLRAGARPRVHAARRRRLHPRRHGVPQDELAAPT